MNIDDLTLGQIKRLKAMMGGKDEMETAYVSPHIGKKCIIRTYASGVHFGTVTAVDGRTVELIDARRLWRWDAAPHGVSLSEVAIYGSAGSRSKICVSVDNMTVLDALEIIPCSDAASSQIENAEVYKP